MADVIPFNVATAAKCDESHAEEVPAVVPVSLPVSTVNMAWGHSLYMQNFFAELQKLVASTYHTEGEEAALRLYVDYLLMLPDYLAAIPPPPLPPIRA